jgi:pyruvate/2-oxoacid:ferredoxin oxidoreductase beta subunit
MTALKYTTYMTEKVGALPFCPGCGHGNFIRSLDRALVKLQLDPKEVVIVTDIGCIGLADRYFDTNAFHGLHGRAITYACGLKLARPELTVIAIMGDGGCGIGGTHLLNVARRNIGITLLVANNFNYGMTGGQHSVTTPSGGRTATTPWGNVEYPMDLCGTAAAAGGAWVYRTTVYEKNLADIMARAIDKAGFSMIEVWELCTAYYAPQNRLKKKQLYELLESSGFELGRVADNPRPEYSVQYREAYELRKEKGREKPKIEPQYTSTVKKQTGLIISGSAGQKIKSTATLFGAASMYSGLKATQKDDYPITVMTGHSLAEIIISPDPIEYTGIDSPDYVLVISEDGLRRARAVIEDLPESCTLYAEESLTLPETKARILTFPFRKTALQISAAAITTVAASAMLEHAGLFPLDAFRTAISAYQKPAIAEINLRAVEAGEKLVIP